MDSTLQRLRAVCAGIAGHLFCTGWAFEHFSTSYILIATSHFHTLGSYMSHFFTNTVYATLRVIFCGSSCDLRVELKIWTVIASISGFGPCDVSPSFFCVSTLQHCRRVRVCLAGFSYHFSHFTDVKITLRTSFPGVPAGNDPCLFCPYIINQTNHHWSVTVSLKKNIEELK